MNNYLDERVKLKKQFKKINENKNQTREINTMKQTRHDKNHELTYGNIGWTVWLQGFIKMGPHFGDPVHHSVQVVVSDTSSELRLNQPASQKSTQEAFHLHVVST